MTKNEALKLALEVLEEGVQGTRPLGVATLEAIATIKEALAQPSVSVEQEPVMCVEYLPCCTDKTCSKCKAATPPQRTWVGLTDDEIEMIYAVTIKVRKKDIMPGEQKMFAKTIEHFLKERNT